MSQQEHKTDRDMPADLDEAKREVTVLRDNLRAAEEEIHRLRTTDPLTGAGNRRSWDDAVSAELLRIKRYGGGVSIIIAEIDDLDSITERNGHAAGDKLLTRFVGLIMESTRKTDSVYRLGDAKFSVLMPHTRLAGADMIAERIRGLVADGSGSMAPEPVSASFGVAEFKDGEGGIALVGRADDALYRARREGGNKVFAS